MEKNRILIVNNYSMRKSLKMIEHGDMPRHHAWGIDRLADKFRLRFLNYHCPTILTRFHLARIYYIYFQIATLIKSIGCSGVYAAASPLINLLGSLKHRRIISKCLVMVVHHPGNFSLKNKVYDKIVFITRAAYNQALKDYPDHNNLMVYNEWGPDMEFYKQRIDSGNCGHPITFMSIGKSNRDHDSLVTASKGLNAKTTIICTENSAPKNYDEIIDRNIKLIKQENNTLLSGQLMSYREMVGKLSDADVAVIPIPTTNKGLCGLTSFNDAIALGKPVIVADTANLGIDIEKEGIGYIYKAGDPEDLRSKMELLIKDPQNIKEMGCKARLYALSNDNAAFSENIIKFMRS